MIDSNRYVYAPCSPAVDAFMTQQPNESSSMPRSLHHPSIHQSIPLCKLGQPKTALMVGYEKEEEFGRKKNSQPA